MWRESADVKAAEADHMIRVLDGQRKFGKVQKDQPKRKMTG